MLWKVLTLVGVGLAIYGAARRALAAAGVTQQDPAQRRVHAHDMVPCRTCGAWVSPGDACACRTPPTP